jgi:nucleotide-binding universal stress UspA family protein
MRTVLVCLDGSEREKGVLDAALGVARRTGAKLVLLRCVGLPYDLPAEAYAMNPDDVEKVLAERAHTDLRVLERAVPEELRGGARVVVGSIAASIQRSAEEVDADLVVVGAHGYNVVDRVVGTTAARVVNHADRSVLVVRAADRLV